MIKLLKWTLAGFAAVTGSLALLFGTDAFSYGSTLLAELRGAARGAVPVSFELARVDGLLRDVDAELHRCRQDVARAEVGAARLQGDVASQAQSLAATETQLRQRHAAGGPRAADAALSGSSFTAQFALQPRAGAPALRDLFETCRRDRASLDRKRSQLGQAQAAVAAARTQMARVQTEQSALRDQLAALRLQKLEVEALASTSPLRRELDTGALAAARRALDAVRERLEIDERVVADGLSVEKTAPGDDATALADAIDAYFAELDGKLAIPASRSCEPEDRDGF